MIKLLHKIIFFSDHLSSILKSIRFGFIVFFRIIHLGFKKNRKLSLVELYYTNAFQFDKAFIHLRYNFKNAIYYYISDYGYTLNQRGILLNKAKIRHENIVITAYGFFQRRNHNLIILSKNSLNSESFLTQIVKKEIIKLPEIKTQTRYVGICSQEMRLNNLRIVSKVIKPPFIHIQFSKFSNK